jgi:hypothetical protein
MDSEKQPHWGGHGAPLKVIHKDICKRPSKVIIDSRAVAAER